MESDFVSNKTFEERVNELKRIYDGVNDFDFETIIRLEDEYNSCPLEHTTRRKEILRMRNELFKNLIAQHTTNLAQSRENKHNSRDVYIDWAENGHKFSAMIYYDGRMYYINGDNISDVAQTVGSLTWLKNKNIYLMCNGFGVVIADELKSKGIKYNSLPIIKTNLPLK